MAYIRLFICRHGDIIHLRTVQQFYKVPEAEQPSRVEEDAVDQLLRRMDGKIVRGKDPHYCHHGDTGMCSHCTPLEPYDGGYREEKGIKHASLHAHLRQLAQGARARPVGTLLEEPSFRVPARCPGGQHPPYPEGICTKCQPSAIILNTQAFRMVDHVELDSPRLIEDFLAGWRASGYQRFGWLLGRYDVYEGVPLGIKAVVQAIYEPPQDGSVDGFQLLEDAQGDMALGLTQRLGMAPIGMIYTDLTDDGSRAGKVLHKRSAETFFVSSAEALFMAQNQLAHPSPCRDSPSGHYSSKFVTLIVTGNERREIDFTAFQVSVTAEAMVQADIIEATTDPNLVMVKPSIPKQHYVPEVMYKLKDEYGNMVQRKADPFFPVEFLLLTLSHGFPVQSDPFLRSPLSFPAASEKPTMAALRAYIEQAKELPLSIALSNFNLLAYIATQQILEEADLQRLCTALARRDETELLNLTLNSPSWATLMAVAAESARERPAGTSAGGRDWTCPHCTFINVERTVDGCEMCGLPQNA